MAGLSVSSLKQGLLVLIDSTHLSGSLIKGIEVYYKLGKIFFFIEKLEWSHIEVQNHWNQTCGVRSKEF